MTGWQLRAIALLVASGLVVAPTPVVRGQDAAPVTASQRMERVGQLGGLVSAVTTDGLTALVAEGESLLRLDVSGDEGGSLPVLARLNLGRGAIQQVVEAFPITYVLTESGLVVMQGVHDAPLPQPVAFVPGGGQAMAAGQGAVYVAARDAGLRVVDVSVPQRAYVLASLVLPGQAADVALTREGLALVAAGEAGLHVVDVRNPAQPALFETLDLRADSVALADSVLGPLLYVGSGGQVLVMPAPVAGESLDTALVGRYAPLSDAQGVALSPDGEFAYVAGGEAGLLVYDLAVPEQVLQVYADPPGAPGPARDVALSPDEARLLVASGAGGLRILDASEPAAPVDRFDVALPGEAGRVAFSADGGRGFVALGAGGLAVVDANTAAVLGVVPLEAQVRDVVTDGPWAYVALGEDGLAVLRIDGQPDRPPVASLDLPGDAQGLTLLGDTLYVASGAAGLVAVDVLRPAEPRLAGQLAPEIGEGAYTDVAISGKRAFVADGQGVAIVDVADTTRMVHLSRADAAPAAALALSEQGIDLFLYTLSPDRLASYEVSISTDPALLGIYQPIQAVSRIVPHAGRLLLTNGGDGPGIVVLDVDDPRLPREVGWVGSAGHSLDAAAHDEMVLVAGGLEGVSRLSLGGGSGLSQTATYNPLPDLTHLLAGDGWLLAGGGQGWSLVSAADLRPLSRAGADLRVRGLARDGALVVVATARALYSYDVSDPLAPQLIASREFSGAANGLALNDRFLFVADGAGGLEILARDGLRPVTRVPLPAGANAVALDGSGSRAFLALDDGTLAVVDVADPSGGLVSDATFPLDAPARLTLARDGQRVLALSGRDLGLFHVESSGQLVRVEEALLRRVGSDVVRAGDRLLVPIPGGQLDLYALNEVRNAAVLENLALDAAALAPDPQQAGIVYVAHGEGGLSALSLDDGTLADIDTSRPAYALLLDGDVLYAAGTELARYAPSADAPPREVASAPLDGPARSVSLAGDTGDSGRWLYVSTVNGIDVLRDLSPDGPLEAVSHLPLSSGARQVVAGGNRAYAAPVSSEGGLLVLNTADPGQPAPLFTYRSPMGATVQDMVLLGDSLLVSWEGGLELLDVGQPATPPALLAALPTGGVQAVGVSVDGARAYASLGSDGVAILDVSRLSEAQALGLFDTPGLATTAAARGDVLFVADGPCGVRVLDVSDPRLPQERGFWMGEFARDVAVSPEGVVYAATGTALRALRYLPTAPPVPPPVPRDPSPPDGAAQVETGTQLGWGPQPEACNPLRYEVSLGLNAPPPFLGQVAGQPGLDPGNLRGLATYHWQVRATDLQGDAIEGPSWSFSTGRGGLGAFVSPDEPPIFLDWLRAFAWLPAGLAAVALLVLLVRRRRP